MITYYIMVGIVTLVLFTIMEVVLLIKTFETGKMSFVEFNDKFQKALKWKRSKFTMPRNVLSNILFIIKIILWPLSILYIISSYIINKQPYVITTVEKLFKEYDERKQL